MAENLLIHTGNKEEKYRELLPQLQALVSSETNRIANLANIAAALKQTFHFFWVGFYMVEGNELVLAPFQVPRLYTHSFRQRSLRHGMEGSADADCS